jgi:hypothetical protein
MRRVRLLLLCALSLATLGPVGPPPIGHAVATAAPLVPPPRQDGQFLWTAADRQIFTRARARKPDLAPGILVGTIYAHGTDVKLRRGSSPRLAGVGPVEIVVRLDDSLSPLFDSHDLGALTRMLGDEIGGVLDESRDTGASVAALVLDFDAPVRLLSAWAEVVARLTDGRLSSVPVWVTSIPAHLADPSYGARLAGHVEGHVLQLFDTGLTCNAREIARVRSELRGQPLPYRLGVASYERRKNGRVSTQHGCFRRFAAEQAADRRFAGIWVFAASREYGDPA